MIFMLKQLKSKIVNNTLLSTENEDVIFNIFLFIYSLIILFFNSILIQLPAFINVLILVFPLVYYVFKYLVEKPLEEKNYHSKIISVQYILSDESLLNEFLSLSNLFSTEQYVSYLIDVIQSSKIAFGIFRSELYETFVGIKFNTIVKHILKKSPTEKQSIFIVKYLTLNTPRIKDFIEYATENSMTKLLKHSLKCLKSSKTGFHNNFLSYIIKKTTNIEIIRIIVDEIDVSFINDVIFENMIRSNPGICCFASDYISSHKCSHNCLCFHLDNKYLLRAPTQECSHQMYYVFEKIAKNKKILKPNWVSCLPQSYS